MLPHVRCLGVTLAILLTLSQATIQQETSDVSTVDTLLEAGGNGMVDLLTLAFM